MIKDKRGPSAGTVAVGVLLLWAGVASVNSFAADAALEAVAKTIETWGKDPVFVKTVAAQNAQKMTLARIQEIDAAWINGKAEERVRELTSNACAARLKELSSDHPDFLESFVMDNQGALVCATGRTSDYWQGDEPKWQKAYDEGRGGVLIEAPRFDRSAKASVSQISVPVKDGTIAIGAITVGVKASRGK